MFEPLGKGIGEGKAFHFLFGFKTAAPRDMQFLEMENKHIDDDIETLRKHGYTVVVDQQATRQDFLDMVAGKAEGAVGLVPAGFYWSAHGHEDGAVECCDGSLVKPDHVDPNTVHKGLRLAIFASCYVGSRSRTWRERLGGHPLVVGWGRPVTIDRAVEFLQSREGTETDFDDLIHRYLLSDRPLPSDAPHTFSPTDEAAAGGKTTGVPERVKNIVDQLGAMWRTTDSGRVQMNVPLESNRRQVATVFVCDSNAPFAEGEPLLGVESDVGEISSLVDLPMLLGGLRNGGYARPMLVKGPTEMPRLIVQGFLPLARSCDADLATLVYQVCEYADQLEQRIFGGDSN